MAGHRLDSGLIVQDAGAEQRWLPRARLSDFLGALHTGPRGRLLELTEPFDWSLPEIPERFRIGTDVLVRTEPDGPWTLGEVRDGRGADELLVRLGSDGDLRWFLAADVQAPAGGANDVAERRRAEWARWAAGGDPSLVAPPQPDQARSVRTP